MDKFWRKYYTSVQATELSTWQRRVSELTGRISELEETLSKTQKELLKAQEANAKLQRDLRENVAQKEDQVGLFYWYVWCCISFHALLSWNMCDVKFMITVEAWKNVVIISIYICFFRVLFRAGF
jgi:hypothetical protein